MDIYLSTLSLSDAKSFLNLTDTSADAWLTREIASQLQAIEVYLDRPVVVRRFQSDIDGLGERSLIVNHAPLQAVLSLRVDAERKFGRDTVYSADRYSVGEDRVDLEHTVFPCGDRNVRLISIAGFAEIEIPFSRQRFDIRESSGGPLLTAYLPAGLYSPSEAAEALADALNDVGDEERAVAFDWVQRQFVITQAEGYLEVVPFLTGTFTQSESAAGLLGWTTQSRLVSGVLRSGVVSLRIPEAIRLVALESIAEQYSRGTFGNNHYGIRSYWLDDYRVVYEDRAQAESGVNSAFSAKHLDQLAPFKRWTLF